MAMVDAEHEYTSAACLHSRHWAALARPTGSVLAVRILTFLRIARICVYMYIMLIYACVYSRWHIHACSCTYTSVCICTYL